MKEFQGKVAIVTGGTSGIGRAAAVAFATLFASTGEDQMVRIWNLETKKEVKAFRGSTGAILNVRFSPESGGPGFLIAGGKDGTARMWNLADLNIAK